MSTTTLSPQPKRDVVLNVLRQKDRVWKTSLETTNNDNPATHLKKYKKQQNTNIMLLIKPKDTRFHKRRLKSNLSFLRLFIVDQFMRLIEGSTSWMKDCSWSINYSAVAAKIMICRAEDVRNSCSTT
jgi:hypothetical protein